ncbi:MAG TPA: 50S ribosomal protein L20 [Phycisphaerae bacterium]|nr:50S ribosomal protein L20 [Phycisphaerae bacterium]
MPRTRKGAARRQRKKSLRRRTKGYFGARGKLYRVAKQSRMKADQYAYRDRRAKKRDFRRLWITRISAACRQRDISYSQFVGGLKKAAVELDRKALAELALNDPKAFDAVVDEARAALGDANGDAA